MNWDDLNVGLAVARTGSLAKAAMELDVDHTTVGRRVEALEKALGLRLFVRSARGYVLSAEGERLLPELQRVEAAVYGVERSAQGQQASLSGTVRVTSGESFGVGYLAPRLAEFGQLHDGLSLELITGGTVLDLARREADIAVRLFRTTHEHLAVRKVGELKHALYASSAYLARRPLKKASELKSHRLLVPTPGPRVVESEWVRKLSRGATPAFVSTMTLALVEAAKRGAGVAVLPRYLGDAERTLERIPMPDEPAEPIWVTVHRDLRNVPRVRVVLDFLVGCLERDMGTPSLQRGRGSG
ncbi:MAG TPA: LysR family transcriptional regulator [Archangium sp.]